jgi:hypothetical protein
MYARRLPKSWRVGGKDKSKKTKTVRVFIYGGRREMTREEVLAKEFNEECERIAEECEAEGYPPYGSNWELRVDNLMQSDYYAELFEEVLPW